MSNANSNPRSEPVRRRIKLPHPRVLAFALSFLFEVVEAFFGPRHRRVLEVLARRTAVLYGADGPAFRKRLDSALNKRRLGALDWWEDDHGQPAA